MTNHQHPITPPDKLVQQWIEKWFRLKVKHVGVDEYIATEAARWGLEACCEWLEKGPYGFTITASAPHMISDLRAAMRPKPPSLAEEGLEALKRQAVRSVPSLVATNDCGVIRAALERLQELEKGNE